MARTPPSPASITPWSACAISRPRAASGRRLGFTLTPRGRHIGWGTGNYCIMLENGYIELLGIVDPSQFCNNLDSFWRQREGLMGLAFARPTPTPAASAESRRV